MTFIRIANCTLLWILQTTLSMAIIVFQTQSTIISSSWCTSCKELLILFHKGYCLNRTYLLRRSSNIFVGKSIYSTFLLRHVCVCVVIPFILDVRFVDVPAGVTQEEGHTLLFGLPSAVLALICSREGFSHSYPSKSVKSNFVY